MAAGAIALTAHAQPDAPPADPNAQPAAAPGAQSASQGEIDIVCDAFGVGGAARAGEWTGVRLRLTDQASKPRAVAICFWQPDPDGDTALVTREITLNPGVTQALWLYAPLGWKTSTSSEFTITAHSLGAESAAPADQDDRGGAPTLGRQVAAARVSPRAMHRESDSIVGVVGRSPAGGLVRYAASLDGADPRPIAANERTEVVTGLTPADLPDRWMGLTQFETLVWISGDPAALSERQAEAVREWVQRGGHLVISLPSVGQAWSNPRTNPLQDMLPNATITREEGVSLEPLRALLRPRDSLPMPDRAVVQTISPKANAEPGEAVVVLGAPDGRPIVVRRALGAGMVTLVGLDFAQQSLAERVDVQFFWHRALGKRFDVLSREQMQAARAKAGFLGADPAWTDSDIPGEIAKSGRAGVGVLLGLCVFGAYLLLAGPLGFAMLRRRGGVQHAWVAFVAVAAGFSALAWGGATAMRPLRAEVQHLTVLDHVYGQPLERARSWFSALLPTYGEQRVSIEPGAGADAIHNALRPWDSPLAGAAARFPDARPYALDARAPDELRVPTRSTVKAFQADWLGAPAWPGVSPEGGEVRVDESGDAMRLVGRLTHSLPAPLTDVTVLLVRRQKPLSGELGDNGPLLSVGLAWAKVSAWPAGEALDLSSLTPTSGSTLDGDFEKLSGEVAPASVAFASGVTRASSGDVARRLRALSFFSALRQPRYLATSSNDIGSVVPARRAAHGLDLSAWLTQPCLIVLGQIERGPCPVPIRIDGAEAPSAGRTYVRWVYPLPSNPPGLGER